MDLRLPTNGTGEQGTAQIAPGKPLIVIGANGAGKSRFTDALVEGTTPSLRLSALSALYSRTDVAENAPSGSLISRLNVPALAAGEGHTQKSTLIELLLTRLMHDEMVNLIGYKIALADGRRAELKRTRLDRVIELWQEVFPTNRVLIDSGKILFTKLVDDDRYGAVRLSDGERAVLFYAGAILYAPKGAVIFVDSPEIFLHPTLTIALWNRLESLRADCSFCYTTHDPEFAASRNGATIVWVRECDTRRRQWDYELLPQNSGISREIFATLAGSRKPVLFIEGEPSSIDARLYPLIFPDYTVRSLGSCNRVIEATRTFNDLNSLHKMDSFGIVDRDRRNDEEVAYLRRKNIMVPEVAEVENIFVLEDVVAAMARANGKDWRRAVDKVRKAVFSLFRAELRAQALMHTRHRVKRTMEYRVDARCDTIGSLEQHLLKVIDDMAPRRIYEEFCGLFHKLEQSGDYAGVLRVFNQKSMLSNCNVAPLCGYHNKDEYIEGVIALLRSHHDEAANVRRAVRRCLKTDSQPPV